MPTKDWIVKAMVFLAVVYGCESWTIKIAECRRIDAFELWCWRRLLRVPWTARRSDQSMLKEISPEYTLEGLMLKLKLQYFGHLMQRTNSVEKTLMLGRTEGKRRRGNNNNALEPGGHTHPRVSIPQQRKPLQWEACALQPENSPHSWWLEESPVQQQRPSTAENK